MALNFIISLAGSTKFHLVFDHTSQRYIIYVRDTYNHLSLSNVVAMFWHDDKRLNRYERSGIFANRITYSSGNDINDFGILKAENGFRLVYNCSIKHNGFEGTVPLGQLIHQLQVSNYVELIVDFHILTQAKICCTLCIKCKHVYNGIHESSKCSPSYAQQNILCLSMSENLDGEDGSNIRSLLQENF